MLLQKRLCYTNIHYQLNITSMFKILSIKIDHINYLNAHSSIIGE